MQPDDRHLRDVSAVETGSARDEMLAIEEIDALEALAEFEVEHRRILAMQALFYRRRKAGGVA